MDRVNGADFVDIGGGRQGFRSESLDAGVVGTEVTATWLNGVQEELLKVIENAGLVPSDADWTQLWRALRLGAVGQSDLPVKGRQAAPPGAPAEFDTYIVAAAPTGAWADKATKIAFWTGSTWVFVSPTVGLIANFWNGTREVLLYWNGAAWIEKAVGERAQDLNYRAAAGTANALTMTLDPVPASYAELVGAPLRVKVGATNTAAATLNVNGLGAKPIVRLGSGAALVGGDLAAGGIYTLTYDGTSFQVATAGGVALQSGGSTSAAPKLLNVDATMTSSVMIANAVNTLLQFQTTNNENLGTSVWNGSRLTIGAGEGGLWYVQAAWTFATPQTGIFSTCRIRRNGSAVLGEAAPPYVENGGGVVIQTQTIIKLAEGDYVEAVAAQQAGSAQPASADPRSRFVAMLLSSY